MHMIQDEQVATVSASLLTALMEECDSAEATYMMLVIPALQESWHGFCKAIVDGEIEDGAGLEELVDDAEFWPKRPALTVESHWARAVFGHALANFNEWDELARNLDGAHVSDDDEEDE